LHLPIEREVNRQAGTPWAPVTAPLHVETPSCLEPYLPSADGVWLARKRVGYAKRAHTSKLGHPLVSIARQSLPSARRDGLALREPTKPPPCLLGGGEAHGIVWSDYLEVRIAVDAAPYSALVDTLHERCCGL
jgi:hypothetical protein